MVTKHLFLKRMLGNKTQANTVETLHDQCPSQATTKNWGAEFKRERSNVKDKHRPGRPISVTIVYYKILEDCQTGHQLEAMNIVHQAVDQKKPFTKMLAR